MEPSASYARPHDPALRRLVDFYDPSTQGFDTLGRTLDKILSWTDVRLENQHDYIQILFPLPEGSLFNGIAPIIDEETMLYIRGHHGVQRGLGRSYIRILAFYGFDVKWVDSDEHEAGLLLSKQTPTVAAKENPRVNFGRWVRRMDHNHLRITRIIRSLRILGMTQEAAAFYAALMEVCRTQGHIGQSSRDYWKRAMEQPLHIAPDGTEVKWLEKYDGEDDDCDDAEEESCGDSSNYATAAASPWDSNTPGSDDGTAPGGTPATSNSPFQPNENIEHIPPALPRNDSS